MHAAAWMDLENMMLSEPVTKNQIAYGPIYMKCPEKATLYDRK